MVKTKNSPNVVAPANLHVIDLELKLALYNVLWAVNVGKDF